MTPSIPKTTLAISALLTFCTLRAEAFTALQPKLSVANYRLPARPKHMLHATSLNPDTPSVDDQVQRLREMASKLRTEAAELESEQQVAMKQAAQRLFHKFDLDQNGSISFSELQQGLEKLFKGKEQQEQRTLRQMFDRLDKNGDGELQPQEFVVSMDQIRSQLDAIAHEERQAARQQAKQAREEQDAAELAEVQLQILNDGPPTATDKLVSVLPYLFPLIDGLQFARFLIEGHPDNPLSMAAVVAYTLYRSIPLGGLIPFLGLSFLSDNPSLNKLIRFNMQQAVFLDIALFVPALVLSLGAGALNAVAGVTIPPEVTVLANDALFAALVATVGYATVSSLLLGQTPDQIPGVSQRVADRMLTPDMFDADGRFQPFDENGELKTNNKKKNDSDEN